MSQENSNKLKILIVDDSEINRSILADILGEEYVIYEAADGDEALEIIEQRSVELSAVLLDILMPRKNGFEVLSVMNQRGWIETIPVIIISAETGSKQVEQAYNLGATDFITRPFDALVVHHRVINTILLYAKQKKLLKLVVDQVSEKERLSNILVDILSHVVEFRNGESGQHILHIRSFTEVMLRQLQRMTDRYALKKADISQISLAAALHDIGKIAIEEKILNKPGRLTPEEFEVMKTHAELGAQMLEKLPGYQDTPLVQTAWQICRWHHERYDGRGYPDGLKGDEIPISAQVVALADVYDALISDRCYKKAIPHAEAIQMILRGECGTFNPLLMNCLREVEGVLNTEFICLQSEERQIMHSGLIKELLHGENAFASERSLNLIEQERMEHGFFSAMTGDMSFKYTVSDDTLRVSDLCAQRLNIDGAIVDPVHDEALKRAVGETTVREIVNAMQERKPDDPAFYYECLIIVNGAPRWYRITVQAKWQDDERMEVLGWAADIHDARLRISMLEQRAAHDAGTELLNHASAREQIVERMKMVPDGCFALAIFDLDNFKAINDTYGHSFGDRVLRAVAEKARQSVRGNDIVARIGGDEFMIFMEYRTDAEIERIIQRIFNVLTGTYEGVESSISLGVAKTNTVGHEYDALFRAADLALYSAKRSGRRSCLFYDDSMKETLSVALSEGQEA